MLQVKALKIYTHADMPDIKRYESRYLKINGFVTATEAKMVYLTSSRDINGIVQM